MSLLVISSGQHTTVQDEGRPGYREWGVPPAGAFDRESYALANALLGNPPGCAALELLRSGPPPAVIVLDLMMRNMTGWELIDILGGDVDLARIPVVILTANPESAPSGYRTLTKPTDPAELAAIVRDLSAAGADR